MRESNYGSNVEDSRENRQSAFAFNRKRQIDAFLFQLFHVGDLTVNVEALTCCERALPDATFASLRQPIKTNKHASDLLVHNLYTIAPETNAPHYF